VARLSLPFWKKGTISFLIRFEYYRKGMTCWRANAFRSIFRMHIRMHIDDDISGSSSCQKCLDCAIAVFVINQKKGDFIPKQTGERLGTIVDTSHDLYCT